MMKRMFALLMCVAMLLGVCTFTGCSNRDYGEKGQYITMYLTDNIYDLDPANAYNNDALASVVGLMFETLFVLDEDGDVSPSLVKKWWTEENDIAKEYTMFLRLKETRWSDGVILTADDIVFAWQRLLEPDANYEAACLLFDIKNARAVKEGGHADGSTATIDDVGISAPETDLLEIQFEGKIDYEHFLLNLTSVALAPLRDDVVDKKGNPITGRNEDWAKKAGTMVCSGPFKLSTIKWVDESGSSRSGNDEDDESVNAGKPQRVSDFMIERNPYYYRDASEDSLFKSVLPYRISVDCSLTDEQIKEQFEAGMMLYIGDIPMSLRTETSGALADAIEVAEKSMATNSIYLNFDAEINGEKLFAKKEVRQALSMAIDREALAKAVVYAEVATGLIPTGVFESDDAGTTFREACTTAYNTLKKDTDAAKALLKGINTKSYSFTITAPAYDEVQCFIAEEVAKAWTDELGFKVKVNYRGTIANDDFYTPTASTPVDICDDLYAEDLRDGNFEAIIFDACAYSPDAFGMLAPFAQGFTGRYVDLSSEENYFIPYHVTGFNTEAYDELIEATFAEKDIAKRADLCRQAEATLMDELPIIPILFNLEASAKNDSLTDLDETYYVKACFTEAYIENYDEYVAAGRTYIETDYKFAELAFHQSKDCPYAVKPKPEEESGRKWENWLEEYNTKFETFKGANSIYAHFFMAEKDAETAE